MSAYAIHSQAYLDGYKNGQTDKRIGIRSEYAWHGLFLDAGNVYSVGYSQGYRDGWLGLSK